MTQVLSAPSAARPSWLVRTLRARVLDRLAGLRAGAVRLRGAGHGADGDLVRGEPQGPLGCVDIEVRDAGFWRAVALRGALGAGEAWVAGHWTSPDPARVVRILLRDRAALERVDAGVARLFAPALRAGHALRRNTRRGARANIAAHYDLGDDFFAAFLDPTMTYSSAVFPTPETDLETAQLTKLRRLCGKLDLGPGHDLLEIGAGWGSLAVVAAGEFGARVTTTTISRRQLEAARARVAAAGLGDRVTVQDRDYRDLRGAFDKVVSVEMIEAVGHHYLPTFFARVAALLRPGGRLAMQAITIADRHYAAALRRVDFIKRYVFPGCCIPSVRALVDAAAGASDLRLRHLEDHGRHYAETLRRWRAAFVAGRAALRARGYPEALLRTWEWYLAYCEGGFAEGHLGVAQLVFERPGGAAPTAVGAGGLPAVAADPYAPPVSADQVRGPGHAERGPAARLRT